MTCRLGCWKLLTYSLNSLIISYICATAGFTFGYYLSIFFIDTVGRRVVQIIAFLCSSTILFSFGFVKDALPEYDRLFITLLAMCTGFGHVATCILPIEAFATRYRGPAYVLSISFSEVGVIGGFAIMLVLSDQTWKLGLVGSLVFVRSTGKSNGRILGIHLSALVPETKQKTFEELGGLSQIVESC